MLQLPFFTELEASRNVLIAGAGGGFDVFCGLPLYFALRGAGKQVHFANLSFSPLPPDEPNRLTPVTLRVTERTPLVTRYFPEKYLSRWFAVQEGAEVPVYCFDRAGVLPIREGYECLARELDLDTIILVDGGTDSLMRGDESGLGTPSEDMTSLAAVADVGVARKLLVCLGFGVDYFHGVCHAQFLEGVAAVTRAGGYLGAFSLTEDMPETSLYRAACEYVFEQMPEHTSIVSTSVLAALAGHYGNHHSTPRTGGSKLWINPLMPVYWCFRLAQVTERVLYLDALKNSIHFAQVHRTIALFRAYQTSVRPWEDMMA